VELGVSHLEAHLGHAGRGGALTRPLEHGKRDVDAEHPARGAHAAPEIEAGVAAAAAHVDDPFTGDDRGTVHRTPTEGSDLAVEHRLVADPLRAGGLVPVADLLGVGAGGLE
jgi:hypothetical protein